MGLVLDWKKKLGYKRDPFEPAILRPTEEYIVGFEKQQEMFNLFLIKEEQLGIITGEHGTGKTTFLAWALDILTTNNYKANFVDARKAKKQVNLIDTLLASNTNLLTRKMTLKKPAEQKYKMLLKKLSKPHVLLIDNASAITPEGMALFSDIIDKTQTHVVFADEKLPGIPGVKLKLKTPAYSEADLTLLLQKRIEHAGSVGTFPFDEKECKKLVKASKGSPATLLTITRERAIELSLKVKELPKPVKPETNDEKVEVKHWGFLNLRIDRSDEEEEEAPPEPEEPEPEEEENIADEEMLKKMLGSTEESQKQDNPAPSSMKLKDLKDLEKEIVPKKKKKKK